MGPQFRPLTATLGAEVVGVDLSEPQPAEVMAEIARAWNDYGVLLFRNQDLTPEAQRTFTEYFAPIAKAPEDGAFKGSEFMHIGNVSKDGVPTTLPDGEMWCRCI